MTATILLVLMAGIALLYVGGEAMVRGAVATGMRMGMTPLAAGLTIVAFGTSAPELVVNLDAVSVGATGLALGNVVGSNIANIGLILGVAVLMRPAPLDSRVVRREIWVMIGASALTVLMLWDGSISRFEGGVLVAGIVAHVVNALREARGELRARIQQEYGAAVTPRPLPVWASVILIVAGVAALVLGGHLFVKAAVAMTEALDVSPALIGLSEVAIGTSLPELAASAVAAWRGYTDVANGNVIGSNIFNIF
jgi:cation:H+ antiporter